MKRTSAISNSTVLSIDWDFFIPEDPVWDIGHNESLMYLKMLWMHRIYLKDKIKTNGLLKNFWKKPLFKGKNPLLFVSDSHAFVQTVISTMGAKRVVLLDAHHDCWPKTDGKNIYCHDWGTHFRDQGGDLTWVYPEDRFHKDMSVWNKPKNLKAIPSSKMTEVDNVIAIHICRSGCWTPPWLDKKFRSFVRHAEKVTTHKAFSLQHGEWDPMKERFTKNDWKQAEMLQKQMEQFRAGYPKEVK
jgi:hypothetical protein